MLDRAVRHSTHLSPTFAVLLLALSSVAWAEKERCVPGADGEWRCGTDITDADAAPLPARTERTVPPMLLIDPRRFGEADRIPEAAPVSQVSASSEAVEAQVAKSEAPEAPKAAEVESKPIVVATPAPARAPTPVETASASDLDFSPPTSGFAVQLSVASSPRGFGALLAKLGKRPTNFQQRQLRNGTWVLLLGNFPTIEAARAAIPSAIPGAFARNLADLSFN